MSEYRFEAAGVFARADAVRSLGRRKDDYFSLSDNALMERYPDQKQRIYAYSFPGVVCELIPEPTNPHDPNAIKVVLDGQHVGYVPASECSTVRALLRRAEAVQARIKRGPCKLVTPEGVKHYDDEFVVDVTITYSGASVDGTRSGGRRGGKANVPVILQWIAAGLLLIFGLAMLPSFASVLFILAAVLTAPIRPLRDLLARYRIRPWMIWIAAGVLTVLAFIVAPGSAS